MDIIFIGIDMSITLQELKRYVKLLEGEGERGPIGTLLYNLGHKEEGADPVKDINAIRSGD